MANDDPEPTARAVGPPAEPAWPVWLKKLAIWGLLLAVLYLVRDFFSTAFMTFLFSYLALTIVGWGMKRWERDGERPGLRRLLTVGGFIVAPLLLVVVLTLVAPRVIRQRQRQA